MRNAYLFCATAFLVLLESAVVDSIFLPEDQENYQEFCLKNNLEEIVGFQKNLQAGKIELAVQITQLDLKAANPRLQTMERTLRLFDDAMAGAKRSLAILGEKRQELIGSFVAAESSVPQKKLAKLGHQYRKLVIQANDDMSKLIVLLEIAVEKRHLFNKRLKELRQRVRTTASLRGSFHFRQFEAKV